MIEELKRLQKQVAKKRHNRLENELHRVANHIRDYLIEHMIGVVAIGQPKGLEEEYHKKNSQKGT